MTQNDSQLYNLTRRKVLAGLGAVGLASAGAGLGTSAFFSDQETFLNNRLVAGSLDMKVDWEEHYSDWKGSETEFAEMAGPEEAAYVLPAPLDNPDARPIALNFVGGVTPAQSKDLFWDATSIEAFPDPDNDGVQDFPADGDPCEFLVDVGADDGGLSSDLRTEGTVEGQTTAPGDPIINIADVKPGDFGEVTFSFHLCDNPGYVWFNGRFVEAAENGQTEPEAEDPQEAGAPDEVSTDLETAQVELLDEIMTRMWYDADCDNQVDASSEGVEADIMLVLDASGSIGGSADNPATEKGQLVAGVEAFVDALPTDGTVQVGQVVFGDNTGASGGDQVGRFAGLGSVGGYSIDYPNTSGGGTQMAPALDIADQELDGNGRSGADKIIVLFTDGEPNYGAGSYDAGSYTAPRNAAWTLDESDANFDGIDDNAETAKVADLVRTGDTRIVTVAVGASGGLLTYLENEIASAGFAFDVAFDDLAAVADSLVATILVGEEVFFNGTLREALVALSGNEGRGIPLDGDASTEFNELTDPENDPDRDCFAGAGTTHCVAFQWWLPVDHANQVQTDSVAFDLGFYTEQCRHNDGAGMVPEETA